MHPPCGKNPIKISKKYHFHLDTPPIGRYNESG
nr:MAG TPA: hypothetical protein [Caudoviricetes sp.]